MIAGKSSEYIHSARKVEDLPPEVPAEQSPTRPSDAPAPKAARTRPADAGPVPRKIEPIERATEGLKRFKLRCDDEAFHPQPYLYILAKNEEDAKKHYFKLQGLEGKTKRELDGTQTPPHLFCKELAD